MVKKEKSSLGLVVFDFSIKLYPKLYFSSLRKQSIHD